MVDGGEPGVDSKDEGKHTGTVIRREDDVDGRASVTKDEERVLFVRCFVNRAPAVHIPRFRIFLYIVYPRCWLSATIALAFDVHHHHLSLVTS